MSDPLREALEQIAAGDDRGGVIHAVSAHEAHRIACKALSSVPDPSEAICDRCGAPKGLKAVGESCNNNCGGKVIANPACRSVPEPQYEYRATRA